MRKMFEIMGDVAGIACIFATLYGVMILAHGVGL